MEHACAGEGRRELNEVRRLANEGEERSAGGGIRLAREREGCSRRDSDGGIVEAHTHIHTPYTLASGCTHRAVKLAHYRLPDSHHELLEKSIEYKKSPWCARQAEPFPLPPSSSSLASASLSPTTLPASHRISRAHTRYPCSSLLVTKRGRARVYTLAIDGDRRHACTHDGQGRR